MSNYFKRVSQYINKNFSTRELLVKFHGIHASVGHTFRCPYHNDKRRSAKLFKDAFYCFACGKQYYPYTMFRENGYSFKDLQEMTPKDFNYEKHEFDSNTGIYKAFAFSFRNDFQKTNNIRKLISNWNTIIDQNGAMNG